MPKTGFNRKFASRHCEDKDGRNYSNHFFLNFTSSVEFYFSSWWRWTCTNENLWPHAVFKSCSFSMAMLAAGNLKGALSKANLVLSSKAHENGLALLF